VLSRVWRRSQLSSRGWAAWAGALRCVAVAVCVSSIGLGSAWTPAQGSGAAALGDGSLAVLVHSLRPCLHTLASNDRHLLALRLGIGGAATHTRAQVAAELHRSVTQESRAELVLLRRLQARRRLGRCATHASATPSPLPSAPVPVGAGVAPGASTPTPASELAVGVLGLGVLTLISFLVREWRPRRRGRGL